jgi:sporulation protein YhbH
MESIFRDFDPKRSFQTDRSAYDRARHKYRVRQAIKDNLGEVVAEESLIGKSGDKTIKIPLRGIKEYRFIYGDNQQDVAQGDGDTQQGQKVGKTGQKQEGNGHGHGGNQQGENAYETEITMDELIDLLYEDLELPNLEQKKLKSIETEANRKRLGYKRKGITVHMDRKKTAIERIKRKIASQRVLEVSNENLDEPEDLELDNLDGTQETRFPFHKKDLRYRKFDTKPKRTSNAVIFFVMDCSGSMDTTKKYFARSFFFLLYQFIKRKYEHTETVWIIHDADAKEVTEDEFFHRVESGGTVVSNAYKKLNEVIADRYNSTVWNTYIFQLSDGENYDSDNEILYKYIIDLIKNVNLLGYCEVQPSNYYSTISKFFETKGLDKEKHFVQTKIKEKSEIWPAVKNILEKEDN